MTLQLHRAIPDAVYAALDTYAEAERDVAHSQHVTDYEKNTRRKAANDYRDVTRRALLVEITDAIKQTDR